MALPVGVRQLGTFAGTRGPAGTFDEVDAFGVPYGAQPVAEITGPADRRKVTLGIPGGAPGLPGQNGVENDDAAAQRMAIFESKSRQAMDAAYAGAAINAAEHGLKTTNTAAQNNTALVAAMDRAGTRQIVIPPGRFKTSLDIVDKHVNITGPGVLTYEPGTNAISVMHQPFGAFSVEHTRRFISWFSSATYDDCSVFGAAPADVATVKPGELMWYSSQDAYAGDFLNAGETLRTHYSDYVPVLGIGLEVTSTASVSSAFPEGSTVRGATSGAVAVVAASGLDFTGAKIVLLKAVVGAFTPGENLRVNNSTVGTLVSNPFIVMAGKLEDMPSQSVRLWHTREDLTCTIDVTIDVDGDPDQPLGDKNLRTSAIELHGVIKPVVNAHFRNAWARGLRCNSVYQPRVLVIADRLPNDARSLEQAYGYAIDVRGSTTGGHYEVYADNVRHGFTTNVAARSDYASNMKDLLATGLPIHNDVYGEVRNAFSSGFDTHAGARYTRFHGTVVVNSRSGGRTTTESVGYQNRAFGTEYIGTRAYGCTVGYSEMAQSFIAPNPYTNRYVDARAYGYGSFGVQVKDNFKGGPEGWVEFDGCFMEGDGTPVNAPHYQVGYRLAATGLRVRMVRGNRAARFNGAPFRVESALERILIDDFFADYYGAPSAVSGGRFDAKPNLNPVVSNYKVWDPESRLPAILRLEAANVALHVSETKVLNRGGVPLLSGTGVSTSTVLARNDPAMMLPATVTWDPPSVSAGSYTVTTVAVPEARVGMPAIASFESVPDPGVTLSAEVVANASVRLTLVNRRPVAVDLDVQTVNVFVFRKPVA